MSKVKITDIAERSGVSLTTVSRYFNHPELLSQETQDKIKAAIKELNYQQDNLARILVTGESNLVGVIFPHLHLSFYTELLNQLIKYGKEKGYNLIVYTSNDSREEELQLIQNLISYRIKGLILLSHLLSAEDIEKLPVPVSPLNVSAVISNRSTTITLPVESWPQIFWSATAARFSFISIMIFGKTGLPSREFWDLNMR